MQTPESARMRLFAGGLRPDQAVGSPLGIGLLSKMKSVSGGIQWPRVGPKDADFATKDMMCQALIGGQETMVEPIGVGIHRPYRVEFLDGMDSGPVTTRRAALKTIHCQYENKRYCASVDLDVTGPEREILSFNLDCMFGFDLVPPTVGREVEKIGFGSVQAWVDCATAWQWIERGYDYREDKANPWLHRLAAFDFIRGEIDRHANNWIMDEQRRVYAIDNGYSIVKGDDRTWFRSSAGKHLVGTPIHPAVMVEILAIDEGEAFDLVSRGRFKSGEAEGVAKRIRELKGLSEWQKLGNLW